MNETNPLGLNPSQSRPYEINRSGRPTDENIIKFGPQPKSLVSQMLKKFKNECGDMAISINSLNKKPEKSIIVENCDADSPIIQITLDPDLDDAKITNKSKDNKNKLYQCDFPNCKYACKLSSNLIKHKRTHTSEKPYLCDSCSFRSKFVNSLKVHQRLHTAEKPYGCIYCIYRCNSSSNLKKHCKHKHSNISIEGQKPKQVNSIDNT